MRQTEYRRKSRAISDGIVEQVQLAAQAELAWLFRQVQLKIRRVNRFRPHTSTRRPKLEKAYTVSGDLWELFRQRMRASVMRALLFGAVNLAQLERAMFPDLQPIEFSSEEFAALIEPELAVNITHVTNNIKRIVGRRVVGWYNSPGSTMQSLVDNLRPEFSLSRAKRIAQTEVTNLNSRVKEETARTIGASEWWWSTRQDELVCRKPLVGPDGKRYNGCRELHGKRFPIGLKMPPKGSHIGCVLPGQVVAVPGLSAGAKSFYSGDVVEILTASGRKITVTPNHPILTDEGYIRAEFIQKGDNVITHTKPKRIVSSVNPNYNHVPSSIENVFTSFKMANGVLSTTVPSAAIDFHGDGRGLNGNINIIYADGKLANGHNTDIAKPFSKLLFDIRNAGLILVSCLSIFFALTNRAYSSAHSFMRRLNLFLSTCFCHLRPFQCFGLALVSWSNIVVNEEPSYSAPANIESTRSLVFRDTGQITFNNLVGRKRPPSSLFSNFNIMSVEDGFNGVEINFELALQFLNRESAFIQLDKVVDINIRKFTGHVYDLQSDLYSLYTCNGIIVSNCRCSPVVVAPRAVATETPKQVIEGLLMRKADFVESEHPRANNGEFTDKGAGSGGSTKHVTYRSGSRTVHRELTIHRNPQAFHGTFSDSADSIKQEGFKPSARGTAGAGVYITFNRKDALYEKDPSRSEAVRSHGGKQPNVVLETKIKGDILDVGTMEAKDNPSMYVPPHIYAAIALSGEDSKYSMSDYIDNPELASQVIQEHGYVGLSWKFSDGRQAAIVFDPSNVEITDLSKADWQEQKHPRHSDGKFAPKGQGEAGGGTQAAGGKQDNGRIY